MLAEYYKQASEMGLPLIKFVFFNSIFQNKPIHVCY